MNLVAEQLNAEQQNKFEEYKENAQWPEPIPFDDNSLLSDFPVDVLPGIGKKFVSEVAAVTQTDAGLPGCSYLGAISASCGGRVTVDLRSHKEPCIIYINGVLPSGDRKSPVVDSFARPIYNYQKQKQEAMKDIIREGLNRYNILTARLTKIQKQAANTDDDMERLSLIHAAAEVAKQIDDNPIPKTPTYLVDDITTEKLGLLMAENNESMAIISAEGGIFKLINGYYSDTDNGNFDLYLKAHAGDSWSCYRIGRESLTMTNPRLTMALAIQPDVLHEIGRNGRFRGRGFLARCLFSIGKSHAGFRERQFKTIPDALIEEYQRHIFELMEIPPVVLTMTDEAAKIWDDFYNDIERELRPGEALENMKDWGSKLPGAVARISGLLHFAENGRQGINKPISVGIVTASCMLGIYFREHALAAFAQMREDDRINSAKKILSYLTRIKPTQFKGRDVLHHAYFTNRTMEDVLPGLKILMERAYIRLLPSEYSGKGRPVADTYVVNPRLYEKYKP